MINSLQYDIDELCFRVMRLSLNTRHANTPDSTDKRCEQVRQMVNSAGYVWDPSKRVTTEPHADWTQLGQGLVERDGEQNRPCLIHGDVVLDLL